MWKEFLARWRKPQDGDAVREMGKLVALIRPAVKWRIERGMTFAESCADIETMLHLGDRMRHVEEVLKREFVQ